MQFIVTMKTPDALEDCIEEAIDSQLEELTQTRILNEEDIELIREKTREELKDLCSRWFRFGECLNVEIDTETKTCKVIPLTIC